MTGHRRAGKTTLLRKLFPKAQYLLLEDPDVPARVGSDPRAFLDAPRPPVVFDEIQNTPELLAYVRTVIDTGPRRMGQWLFTGSQEAPLMQGISESMAGRAAILQLLPFSLSETKKVSLLHGGFPEVLARPKARSNEEPKLRGSFGSEYEAFWAVVPRWIPRLRPPPKREEGQADRRHADCNQ